MGTVADLTEVGREVSVPEERHALAERRRARQHPVDPPLLERAHVERGLLARVIASREDRRFGDRCLDQAIDRLRIPVGLRLIELLRGRAEGGAAQKMRDARCLVAERREPI